MQRKKKIKNNLPSYPEQADTDPILRRWKMQGTVIRKMLAEITVSDKVETDQVPKTGDESTDYGIIINNSENEIQTRLSKHDYVDK